MPRLQTADELADFGESAILKILGRRGFAEFPTIRIPGKIIWFNHELAREIGLRIPSSNAMAPSLHRRLVRLFSLRALRSGEEPGNREVVPLYADQYGGTDIHPGLGAGRAGFLAHGNLYLKGIGRTPLYRKHRNDDFQHTHGGVPLRECMLEAMFGEVNAHLLTKGAARILAIVDQGEIILHPNGAKEARAIAVRAGGQLRPAHLFARTIKDGADRVGRFLKMTRATGQLVMFRSRPRAKPAPDFKGTILRIVDDHARTAAELYRWRMLHGAISLSNMEMSGAMLDTTTQSAQPRTAPMKILTYHTDVNIVYGKEHLQRAQELGIMYRAVVRGVPRPERSAVNARRVDVIAAMKQSYGKHLDLQMLKAVGLKEEAAGRLRADWPKVSARFTKVLAQMAALRNPGGVNANRTTGERIAVLDVFHLLQEYPARYLDAPGARLDPYIRRCLRPVIRGGASHKKKTRARVTGLIGRFGRAYSALMAAWQKTAGGDYGGIEEIRESLVRRAAFENRPLSFLYRRDILREFKEAVDLYKSTGDGEIIARMISESVEASRRNADRLDVKFQKVVHAGRS